MQLSCLNSAAALPTARLHSLFAPSVIAANATAAASAAAALAPSNYGWPMPAISVRKQDAATTPPVSVPTANGTHTAASQRLQKK